MNTRGIEPGCRGGPLGKGSTAQACRVCHETPVGRYCNLPGSYKMRNGQVPGIKSGPANRSTKAVFVAPESGYVRR
jgi:hypothetical protein